MWGTDVIVTGRPPHYSGTIVTRRTSSKTSRDARTGTAEVPRGPIWSQPTRIRVDSSVLMRIHNSSGTAGSLSQILRNMESQNDDPNSGTGLENDTSSTSDTVSADMSLTVALAGDGTETDLRDVNSNRRFISLNCIVARVLSRTKQAPETQSFIRV